MTDVLKMNGFCELSQNEMEQVDGGVGPWLIITIVGVIYMGLREIFKDAGKADRLRDDKGLGTNI